MCIAQIRITKFTYVKRLMQGFVIAIHNFRKIESCWTKILQTHQCALIVFQEVKGCVKTIHNFPVNIKVGQFELLPGLSRNFVVEPFRLENSPFGEQSICNC